MAPPVEQTNYSRHIYLTAEDSSLQVTCCKTHLPIYLRYIDIKSVFHVLFKNNNKRVFKVFLNFPHVFYKIKNVGLFLFVLGVYTSCHFSIFLI